MNLKMVVALSIGQIWTIKCYSVIENNAIKVL